jgi:hypothetical protein
VLSSSDILNTWEEEIGFVSLRRDFINSNYPNSSEVEESQLPLPDEILTSILNPNNLIQIKPWIIKLDPVTESVFVLHVDNMSFLSVLIEQNEFNDYEEIRTYTFEDEVFEMLEYEGEVHAIFCRDDKLDSNKADYGPEEYCATEDREYTIELTVKYDLFGIKKSLWTELKHRDDQARNQADDYVRYDLYYKGKYQPRCQDEQSFLYEFNVVNGEVWDCPLDYSAMERRHRTKKIRLYNASRGLKAYNVESQGKVRSACEEDDNWICVPTPSVEKTLLVSLSDSI